MKIPTLKISFSFLSKINILKKKYKIGERNDRENFKNNDNEKK